MDITLWHVSVTDTHGANQVDRASSGTDSLAAAVTAPLGPAGATPALLQPVTDGLRDVWEGYFGVPIPPGDTNWNAYTHQQLYDMLWHDADVADVGSVADQWNQHGTELTGQAGALRDRQTALRSAWAGDAADSATAVLGKLGDRTEAIGTRATTVGQAARQAGDALTVARHTMPRPTNPLGEVISGVVAGAGVGAVIGRTIGGDLTGGFGAGPGALVGAGIGAVAGGAASMFLANADAAQRKAEAVRVMLTYENSLRDAAHAVPATLADMSGAGSTGDPGTTTSAFVGGGFAGGAGGLGGIGAGVPWQRLVGANSGAAAPRSGAMSGALTDAALARAGLLSADEAASQLATGGMYPPTSGLRGRPEEDKERTSKMPQNPQADYFTSDEGTVVPVIGGTDR